MFQPPLEHISYVGVPESSIISPRERYLLGLLGGCFDSLGVELHFLASLSDSGLFVFPISHTPGHEMVSQFRTASELHCINGLR